MKFVEGSYDTPQEAFEAVKHLETRGYRASDIRLISNATMRDSFMNQTDVEVTTTDHYDRDITKEDESLWEKIKDAFTVDDDYSEESNHDPLMNYRTDIENGKIIVLVEGEYEEISSSAGDPTLTADQRMTDDETIRLKEEQLEIDKTEIQTGEVHVSKRVVEETETIEVPVEHEEIVIERHPVDSDEKVTGNMTMKDEEIVIPVTEEQIEVTKEPVVTEEVTIGKEKVTETKQVKENVEKEELDVDAKGDVDLDNSSPHDQL